MAHIERDAYNRKQVRGEEIDTVSEASQSLLPVKVCEPGRIPETLCEWVGIDFQFCDELVLIGRNCCENRFRENECPVLLLFQVRNGSRVFPPFDDVDSGLVPVHRIQNNLQHKWSHERTSGPYYLSVVHSYVSENPTIT